MIASREMPVLTRASLSSDRRWMDSMTATASSWSSRLTSLPVSTRPVASLVRSTLVGRADGSIRYDGAMELPPDSELSEPIRVSSEPSAPALKMPYIGLCGLLPVSFSERAGITAPLIAAAVVTLTRSRMPRAKALSRWNSSPRRRSMKSLVGLPAFGAFGTMSPGRPSCP